MLEKQLMDKNISQYRRKNLKWNTSIKTQYVGS